MLFVGIKLEPDRLEILKAEAKTKGETLSGIIRGYLPGCPNFEEVKQNGE